MRICVTVEWMTCFVFFLYQWFLHSFPKCCCCYCHGRVVCLLLLLLLTLSSLLLLLSLLFLYCHYHWWCCGCSFMYIFCFCLFAATICPVNTVQSIFGTMVAFAMFCEQCTVINTYLVYVTELISTMDYIGCTGRYENWLIDNNNNNSMIIVFKNVIMLCNKL